jgi:adenosylcobinamide-GDP ribazoletransferase
MSALADGLRLSLTTLTVLPVRGPTAVDRRTAAVAMGAAPLVGLALGAVLSVLLVAVDRSTSGPPLLAAALVVAALALLTRGLHLDGLGDLADGLGSYRSPEQARAVMKQPDVGALGVVAVVLVLAVQVAALVACTSAGRGVSSLVVAVVTARVAVAAACSRGVPAATAGGMGAAVAGTVPRAVALLLALGTATGAAGLLAVETGDGARELAIRGAVVVALALVAAALLLRHAVRRIGGITGDVLGALVEVTTAVVLVLMALG